MNGSLGGNHPSSIMIKFPIAEHSMEGDLMCFIVDSSVAGFMIFDSLRTHDTKLLVISRPSDS